VVIAIYDEPRVTHLLYYMVEYAIYIVEYTIYIFVKICYRVSLDSNADRA